MSFLTLFQRKQLPQLPKEEESVSFLELFKRKQLPLLPKETELQESDFKKLHKNLPDDIFGSECAIWGGVYCNMGKKHKGIYINYYFNKKKESLHRLLYKNYVNSKLGEKQYLWHTCHNKLCCNPTHMIVKKDKDLPKKNDLFKINFQVDF